MEGADQARRINGQYVPDYLSAADWTGQMLLHCLDNIDMVSEHYYASGTQHTDMKLQKKVPIDPPLSFIEWQRAPAVQVRAKYEHYQEYLKRIPALRAKPVPIAIDEWAYFGGGPNSYKTVPAYAWAFHEMFRHSDIFQMGAFTFATAMMSSNRTEAILNPTGMLFKMYRDHFGTIPVEVSGDSPQPKPVFPAGGDQPAVNPGSDTYPLDVSAAFSEDRKTFTIAVLNPSDARAEHEARDQRREARQRGEAVADGARQSMDAVVQVGKKPEVSVDEHTLGRLPETIDRASLQRQHLFVSGPVVCLATRMNAVETIFRVRTTMRIPKLGCAVLLGMAASLGTMLMAQVQTIVPPVVPGAKPVTVEHIKIHGAALEGNLEGDAVDRDVIVFLPPSYEKEKHRRYPVVYALHGYSIGAEQWTHEIHVPQTIEGAFAQGAQEMIVVLPDSKTIYNGSMYSSSETTGDFEKFIAHDVVAYIDAHYRTIPESHEPRTGRPLDGRLRRLAHRHEASRCLRRALHHEPLLHVADGRRRAWTSGQNEGDGDRQRKEDCRGEVAGRGCCRCCRASAPRSLLRLRHGRPIPRIRRCILICRRRTAFRCRRYRQNSRPMRRWPSSISTSGISSSIAPSPWTWAIRT